LKPLQQALAWHHPFYRFTTLSFLLFLASVAIVYRFTPRRWRAVSFRQRCTGPLMVSG
jgi:hypothetical protein